MRRWGLTPSRQQQPYLLLQLTGGTKPDALAEQQQAAAEGAQQALSCLPGGEQGGLTCICQPGLFCEDFCLLEMHALQQEAGEAAHHAMGLWNAHGLPHTHRHTCTQNARPCTHQDPI